MSRTVRLGLVTPLEDRLAPAVAGDLDPFWGSGGIATIPFFGANPFSFTSPTASAVAVQPDGRVVVAGTVPSANINGGTDIAIARLLINGSLDPTFGFGGTITVALDKGGVNDDVANAVAIQPDGRILVAGSATTANGQDFAIARANPDGSPDTTFGGKGVVTVAFTGTSGFVDDVAYAMALQADGKIVLGGSSRFDFAAARLNPDGSLDTTFAGAGKGKATIVFSTSGFNADAVRAIALAPDGKIVMVGYADGADFQYDFATVRLNSNGTLDGTFGNKGKTSIGFDLGGFNADKAYGVDLQSDGKIILVGTAEVGFGFGSNKSDIGVARLNADGTVDLGFGTAGTIPIGLNLGGSFADEGKAVLVQPDDKIVIAGSAERGSLFASGGSFAILRLNPDGTSDPDFGVDGVTTVAMGAPSFFSSTLPGATALATEADGDLIVAGQGQGGFAVVRAFGVAPPEPPEPPLPPDGPSKQPIPSVPLSKLPGIPDPVLAGGASNGTARVLFNQDGAFAPGSVLTFFPGLGVEARTAVGDVNGDLVPDFVGGTGVGVANRVSVIDGKSGAILTSFAPFEETFTGGVFVVAADLNGDGAADVVVTPDEGGGPVVAVYSGARLALNTKASTAQIVRFLGIEDGAFRGGARAALGDVNGDTVPDVVVSAGFLGGPRVALFNGADVGVGNPAPNRLLPDFFAFEESVRNGAFVAAGDADGDGFADLAFGGGPDGAPRVRVVSGKGLLESGAFTSLDHVLSSAQLGNFFAGDAGLRGGVRVTLRDVDGDGKADLSVGSGENEPGLVKVYPAGVLSKASPQPTRIQDPFDGAVLANGTFVG